MTVCRYISADGYMEVGPEPYRAPYEDDDDLLIMVCDITVQCMSSCYLFVRYAPCVYAIIPVGLSWQYMHDGHECTTKTTSHHFVESLGVHSI